MKVCLVVAASMLVACATTQQKCAPSAPTAEAASLQVTPAQPPDIAIENAVAACTGLALKDVSVVGDLLVGRFDVQPMQSRAECGCFSPVVAYRMVQIADIPEEAREAGETGELERVYGTLHLPDDARSASFVLATDRKSFEGVPLTLRSGRKGPD